VRGAKTEMNIQDFSNVIGCSSHVISSVLMHCNSITAAPVSFSLTEIANCKSHNYVFRKSDHLLFCNCGAIDVTTIYI